jgi:hypothetical protein
LCRSSLAPALAADVNYAVGAYFGIAPSLGGNLFTYQHESVFDSSTGIYGMNRKDDAVSTTQIEPLTGFSAGGMFKTLLYDYFQVRIACNYTRSYLGGTGTTVYLQGGVNTALDCEYSFWAIDAPLTFGLVIPFWKDIKISFNCGIAYAYGQYQYSFESTAGEWKGSFAGYGLPCYAARGEYFLTTGSQWPHRSSTTGALRKCSPTDRIRAARTSRGLISAAIASISA